jgi:predicted DNA-binding transcriptional regulator AlpA
MIAREVTMTSTLEVGLLGEKQAACVLGLQPSTLASWRRRGLGPPWFKLGPRHIAYDRRDLDAWIASQRVLGASDRRAVR